MHIPSYASLLMYWRWALLPPITNQEVGVTCLMPQAWDLLRPWPGPDGDSKGHVHL